MWIWFDSHESINTWVEPHHLGNLYTYLHERSNNHVAWLGDNAKYIDIRFDSRTGAFQVRDHSNDRYLLWATER